MTMPFFRALVEDNKDPDNRLRIRVRVLGVHNFEEEDPVTKSSPEDRIQVDDLPWAKQCIPPNVGRVDGKFGRCDVPEKGDWVWVFFEDEAFQKPWYFGIISTPNDTPSDYKQTDNRYELDRWQTETVMDEEKVQVTLYKAEDSVRALPMSQVQFFKDGNVKILSSNMPGSKIDMGGEIGRSSAVNYLYLMQWMMAVEQAVTDIWTAMFTHTHGCLGILPCLPAPAEPLVSKDLHANVWTVNQQTETTLFSMFRPMAESKKLQIPSFEDSMLA